MSTLKILTVQASMIWENKKKNIQHFFSLAKNEAISSDIVIFPEMFSTGFTMNTGLAEKMDGETIQELKQFSKKNNVVILTSLIIEERGKYYNRLVTVFPDEKIMYYDKRHLFTYSGEDKYYTAGKKHLVFDWKGWKIMPLVCYDLRFPVWSRNTQDYDLLIYVANWPERRRFTWQSLLVARALENQCYVAGINRIGDDSNGVAHSGYTTVLNYFGGKISKTIPNTEKAELVTLHKDKLMKFRKKFNFLADRDSFTIEA